MPLMHPRQIKKEIKQLEKLSKMLNKLTIVTENDEANIIIDEANNKIIKLHNSLKQDLEYAYG